MIRKASSAGWNFIQCKGEGVLLARSRLSVANVILFSLSTHWTASCLAGRLQGRQQQGHEDADDGDHHQQLHQVDPPGREDPPSEGGQFRRADSAAWER